MGLAGVNGCRWLSLGLEAVAAAGTTSALVTVAAVAGVVVDGKPIKAASNAAAAAPAAAARAAVDCEEASLLVDRLGTQGAGCGATGTAVVAAAGAAVAE